VNVRTTLAPGATVLTALAAVGAAALATVAVAAVALVITAGAVAVVSVIAGAVVTTAVAGGLVTPPAPLAEPLLDSPVNFTIAAVRPASESSATTIRLITSARHRGAGASRVRAAVPQRRHQS
jgi:hypothetical protein